MNAETHRRPGEQNSLNQQALKSLMAGYAAHSRKNLVFHSSGFVLFGLATGITCTAVSARREDFQTQPSGKMVPREKKLASERESAPRDNKKGDVIKILLLRKGFMIYSSISTLLSR